MPEPSRKIGETSNLESELYLLIAKFLSTGVCKKSAEVLRKEIEEKQLLPKRYDWLGEQHNRSFNEFDQFLTQVSDDHLLKICARVGPILDKEIPPTVAGLQSLLGVGRQSLLRSKEDLKRLKVGSGFLAVRKAGVPLYPSLAFQAAYPPNITKVLMARELSGPVASRHMFSTKVYARLQPYRRLLGHLSSVYCVLFDRTGKYIFTGADDLLVKIWCATDGRLLASLRGHSAEITDMAVNYENTLLAAGSCDKTIRVWCVRTTAPVAVLSGHTGMVTSVQFCPYPEQENKQYLVSTGNDGCVCFWAWSSRNNSFNPKPMKFTERNKPGAQMICSSFSPGGVFLATGSTDHSVRVYNIAGYHGPEKIVEKGFHTDRVDSLQFSNLDCRFISGSKDGTAMIWKYEKQNWHCITLKMTTKLSGPADDEDSKVKLRVTMVGWTLDDSKVITAVSDHVVKVWDSNTGSLCHVLRGHEDEVFVLEPHPMDPRVILSSGHDGRIVLWDLITGTVIKSHFNLIEGQGHGAVFDCKFSPDGQMFAATDSHGHLNMFGFGSNDRFKKVPEEQFFHTDYRPLIRDINHHVLDEQTQMPPHLLPSPFLVDIDGNPYPPNLQRLVPGRENCNTSQLVPYISVSEGEVAILEPVRPTDNNDRPTIDDMIVRLQQEQGLNGGSPPRGQVNGDEPSSSDLVFSPRSSLRSPRASNSERNVADGFSPRSTRSQTGHSRVGMRRTGDVEGVRQSGSNWQSRGNEVPAWVKRVVVKPMKSSLSKSRYQRRVLLADNELQFYLKEKKRWPQPDPAEEVFRRQEEYNARRYEPYKGRKQAQARFSLRTRGTQNPYGDEYEDPETLNFSSSSDTETETKATWDDSLGEESSGSGEYSDWTADAGVNVERSKPSTSKSSSSGKSRHESSTEAEDTDEDEDPDDESYRGKESSKTKKKEVPQKVRKAIGKKIPERFRPPEWLTDVMPHKAPYVPQLGDEVVYFKQGHELYVQAVKRRRIYDIFMRNQPWRQLNLRDQEVAKIVEMTFENHPPRLCCLTLTLLNPADNDNDTFVVKYHDMADVIDFIVLKQNYDQAMGHNWKPGSRFRSAIDKAWWLGTIKSQKPFNENFPDSPFQCFIVKWDNGEKEHMSPWDFEPIDPHRLPDEIGGSVPITPEESLAMMYVPARHEWSIYGQDYDIDRIANGLTRIMELSIAEPFTTPVDLNRYPSYAMVVEYPMDLGTIKARLRNRFYRRLDGAKFDVSYIAINAAKFNEPRSRIVKQAKCVVDLCMKFIESPSCRDPMYLYRKMMENKQSRSQDSQSELDVLCSESDSDEESISSKRLKRKKKRESIIQSNKRLKLESLKYTSSSWRLQCTSLLEHMYQLEDSTPFRTPVNLREYPDYRNIIDCPMDLSTIKEKLEINQYSSPIDFCKDMRLMFQNSRNYNTNKKSRIYSMTIRMQASFEDNIRSIVSDWKSAVKYEEKLRNNQYVSNRRKPFSVVNSDDLSKKLKKHVVNNNHRNDDHLRPGPSRNSNLSRPSKHDEATSLRSRKKLNFKKDEEPAFTKSGSPQVKKNKMKEKLGDKLTNGIMKNLRVKVLRSSDIKMKPMIVTKKGKKDGAESRSEMEPEPDEKVESDKNSESEESQNDEDDDDDDDYGIRKHHKRQRRKLLPRDVAQKNLRPRCHVRHSSHPVRSASLKLQKASDLQQRHSALHSRSPATMLTSTHSASATSSRSLALPARSKSPTLQTCSKSPTVQTRCKSPTLPRRSKSPILQTRSAALPPRNRTPVALKPSRIVTTRPIIQTLSPLHTRSMKLLHTTTASKLSTLRRRRQKTPQQEEAKNSGGSDTTSESEISSKSEGNSNFGSSSSTSQYESSGSRNVNDHTYGKENPTSARIRQGKKEYKARRSTRATTRDNTKATRSALIDLNTTKRKKKLSPRIETRSGGQRTVRYGEESEEDDYLYQNSDYENDTEEAVSVNSRGRLRRLIKHSKTLLSE